MEVVVRPALAWPVTVQKFGGTSVGDLDRLLAALAQPSDEPGPDTLCPAVLELRPVIFLIDGTDRAVRVRTRSV